MARRIHIHKAMAARQHLRSYEENLRDGMEVTPSFNPPLFQEVIDFGVKSMGGNHRKGEIHKHPYDSARKLASGEEVDGLFWPNPHELTMKMKSQKRRDWGRAEELHHADDVIYSIGKQVKKTIKEFLGEW